MLLPLRLGWALLGRGPQLERFRGQHLPSSLQVRRGRGSHLLGSASSSAGRGVGSSRHLFWEPGLPAKRRGVRLGLAETRPQSHLGPPERTVTPAQGVSAVTGGQGSGGSWK